MNKFKLGDEVNIIGKNKSGKIAYVGKTRFSEGEWYGVILDEAKGRNNGCIDGERYFNCPENHGIFVRSCMLEKNIRQDEKVNVTKSNHSNPLNCEVYKDCNSGQTKLKTMNKTMPVLNKSVPKFNPMNTVLKELESVIERQSKELTEMKDQKSKAYENLKKMENQLQKTANDLKIQLIVISDLRYKLSSAQMVIEEFSRKLRDTQKNLKTSEERIIRRDEAVEQLGQMTEAVIIEKEIAEEKTEDFEIRLKNEIEKCKALEIEVEIMKEEMNIQCINGVPSVHAMKRLESQNMVLNNALRRLSKLYQSLQEQHSSCEKAIQNASNEIKNLKEAKESRENDVSKCKKEVAELYEVLDDMVIADDIVYEVTERNLKSDEEIYHLNQLLRDMEGKLDISEEMEEILQEMKSMYKEEIDSLELKVLQAKMALEQQILHQKSNEKIIDKYKELTTLLRERNFKLSNDLETALKERNEAVITAENLKLKIHREKRKSLQSMIQEEYMKYDLESLKEELNYWSAFLPDNFFIKGGENSSIQVKLLSSKMIKKLEFIIKLQQMSNFQYDVINCEELENLAIEVRFTILAHQLISTLKIHNESFDHTNVELFLHLSAHHDTLVKENSEIDRYFAFLDKNRFDRQICLDSIRETFNYFSQLLENKFAPKPLKTMINVECYLNVISISCSYTLSFCSVVEKCDGVRIDFKSEVQQMSEITKKIKNHAQSMLISSLKCEKEKLYFIPVVEDSLKAVWNLIRDVMDYLIFIYRNCFGNYRDLDSPITDLENVSLSGIIFNLIQTGNDLEYLRKSINNGEFLAEQQRKMENVSPVYKWAQKKKQEEKQTANNYKRTISSYEMEIINLSQALQSMKRNENKRNNKAFCDISIQTENHDDEEFGAGDNKSSMIEYLKLKLDDMECLVKYLKQKNFKLEFDQIKSHQSIMAPLKVLPRPKYNPEVHNIYILQKRLNKASVVLKSVIIPIVVDITKQNACKLRKYKKYQFERYLTIKGVEEELWCINLEIKRLRKATCCARTNTNPFSLRNILPV